MAGEEHYHEQLLDNIIEPIWEYQSSYNQMSQTTSLRAVDGPYLGITEQPKQRGFRFRYGCEGPSHGGLPGASSEKNRKSYPTVKVFNYQGPARVVVQLVTVNSPLHLHAHSLVGKQCDKGICMSDVTAKESTISFPNLGILHVTKKNVSSTLESRMSEAFRMGYNCGVSIHPDIDALQGEVRIPRELTDHQRSLISSAATQQSKDMDLSVVRLMFTAFLPDSDGGFSRRLEPAVSQPIYDSKAPNASNLKIVRMDRTAGCVTGGEEVYLLCDKVQKDDIQVRFYEEDDSGMTWEALGDFSPTDVHRQFAIVFKTPKYRDQNLQKPIPVFVQLRRKSDNETSDPKPFTYHPQIIDKEEVQRKRQKTLPNFHDFSGGTGGVGGGLYRGGGSTGGGGGGGAATGGGGFFHQGFPSYNFGGGYTSGYSAGLGSAAMKHVPHTTPEDSGEDSDPDEDGFSGRTGVCRGPRYPENRQIEALFQYAMTGEAAFLLAPQRPLMSAQDEDGDTGLHLGVIHRQECVVRTMAQVLSALPGEDALNMRNNLYQTPLHLAVITQQREAVEALVLAGADATLTDRHGNTVLHLAARQQTGELLGFLLQCARTHTQLDGLKDQPNSAGLCALHLAVLANNLQSVRQLLGGGASVDAPERSCGRTPLHIATETDNVSLAGCLLLEGNAYVDSCTYNGSTPLHIAAGRGSVKLTALLIAAGADPNKENFEPLYFRDEESSEEDEDDEGYIPGTTPLNMATAPQVLELLNGKEYDPGPVRRQVDTPQGNLASVCEATRRGLCEALEGPGSAGVGWEQLSQSLGLGILNSAFRLSLSPAHTLLDSYQVSGGTIKELLAGLRLLGNGAALSVLEGALKHIAEDAEDNHLIEGGAEQHHGDSKLDVDGGVCDSGVELSTA